LANCLFRNKDETIREVTLAEFSQGQKIGARNYQPRYIAYSQAEIIQRERGKVGTNHYSLILRNCEHFTCWCMTVSSINEQVRSMCKKTYFIALEQAKMRFNINIKIICPHLLSSKRTCRNVKTINYLTAYI